MGSFNGSWRNPGSIWSRGKGRDVVEKTPALCLKKMEIISAVLFPFHIPPTMHELNCFCGMVERRKAFGLISSWDHCQRSSTSRISDTLRARFETAQNLSSGFVEWSYAVVITTTPRLKAFGIWDLIIYDHQVRNFVIVTASCQFVCVCVFMYVCVCVYSVKFLFKLDYTEVYYFRVTWKLTSLFWVREIQ